MSEPAGQEPARRRVLFIDHETRLSGGERDLVDLVAALDHGRTEVHAAVPAAGPLADALATAGAAVHVVPLEDHVARLSRWELSRRPWAVLPVVVAAVRWSAGLVRLSRRLRPDVVHTNSMKAHVLAAPAAWMARAPLVWHVRDVLSGGWLARAFAALGGLVARRVVCISLAAAEPLGGWPLGPRVRVVRNGIWASAPPPEQVAAARAAAGAGEGAVLVGIVGQIAWWKGQDVFVEAARLLAGEHGRLRFVVVGECLFPHNEGDFDRDVRARAVAPGLDGRIRFLGQVEPIEPVMAAIDVLVHASRMPEPFGRVIVEALSQGTPVITTDQGAGPELVTPDCGAVVPAGDPAALAAAIAEMAYSAGQRAAAARARAAQFHITGTARGVEEVWRELERARP